MDIIAKILENPTTSYFMGFGGLGVVLALALNSAHKFFTLSEKAWGAILLATGAVGGVLIQGTGLVALPGANGWAGHGLAAFVGAATSAAAAGFSSVDMRAMVKKDPKGE